jgi:hypothetical protein
MGSIFDEADFSRHVLTNVSLEMHKIEIAPVHSSSTTRSACYCISGC